MSKYLIIDSREKPSATKRIKAQFDEAGIRYETSKLLFGDYMDYSRPHIVIDRKQNIAELAKNCTREHERFRAELERAKVAGAQLVILVEQNRYKSGDEWISVNDYTDLMLWSSPHTTIRGEKVFRVLASWVNKYNLSVMFCDKRQTGKKILQIIYGDVFENDGRE